LFKEKKELMVRLQDAREARRQVAKVSEHRECRNFPRPQKTLGCPWGALLGFHMDWQNFFQILIKKKKKKKKERKNNSGASFFSLLYWSKLSLAPGYY
jgi:hypothetical protein